MERSLLEILSMVAGCEYLSDLHCLDRGQRKRLQTVLADLPTNSASSWEWNDALVYFTGVSRQNAEQAKTMLLQYLTERT